MPGRLKTPSQYSILANSCANSTKVTNVIWLQAVTVAVVFPGYNNTRPDFFLREWGWKGGRVVGWRQEERCNIWNTTHICHRCWSAHVQCWCWCWGWGWRDQTPTSCRWGGSQWCLWSWAGTGSQLSLTQSCCQLPPSWHWSTAPPAKQQQHYVNAYFPLKPKFQRLVIFCKIIKIMS